MHRRLISALMLLAPADETSGSGTGAPVVPKSIVDAVVDQMTAKDGGSEGAKTGTLEELGIKTQVVSVKDWQPYSKSFNPEKMTLDVLPKMATAFRYADSPLGEKGIRFAQFVKAHLYATKFNQPVREVADFMLKTGRIDPYVHKALSEGTLSDGGPLVPPQFASEMIPLLRARSVLRKSGMRVVGMMGDTLVYAIQNAAAIGYYQGEGAPATYSQAKLGQLKLSVHILVGLTAITDELLKDAGPAADEFLQGDLVQVLALRADLAGLRGDGTSDTPMGIRYQVAVGTPGNVFTATQGGSIATQIEVNGDVSKAVRLVEESNIPTDDGTVGWVFTPRVKQFLMNMLNGLGAYVYRDEMTKGTFQGYPFKTTTQIPQTLGGGSNETEVYFGVFSELIMGERDELSIEVFPGGAYDAGSGLVSGVMNGTTPVRAKQRHDYKLRHTNTFVIIIGCKWGA